MLHVLEGFDAAISSKGIERALSFMSDDCVVEFMGSRLCGKPRIGECMKTLFGRIDGLKISAAKTELRRNVLLQEAVIAGSVRGRNVRLRQSKILSFDDNYAITNMRLYIDGPDLLGLMM